MKDLKWGEEQERDVIEIEAAPWNRYQCLCPLCGKKCLGYDRHADKPSHDRGPSVNGVPIELVYAPRRIKCPEHGVLIEMLPWKDGDTRSLACFNDEVAFLALNSPRSVVSQFFGINWRTVGNCIKAAHDRLEADLKKRFDGLARICVDETSHRKGHRYITVVYDIDRNRVAWLHESYVDTVFELFCKGLSEEQRKGIKVVAGDSAGWITRMTEKHFPNAVRCVDFFPVVQWVNEALEAAKRELDGMPARGRPSKRKKELAAIIARYEKNSASPSGEGLGRRRRRFLKNPGLIEASLPDVYAVYMLKETLRVILHMTDASLAATGLEKWIGEALSCGFQAYEKVAEKVRNNSKGILSAIRMQANSARSEATNTTIKALVKTARGFRSMENMFALIYLRYSDLAILLNNRHVPSPEKMRELRDIASKCKADREAQRRGELNETFFAEAN